MKLLIFVLIILICSCNRTQLDSDEKLLTLLNQENYEYFSRSKNYRGNNPDDHQDLLKLRRLAEKAIQEINSQKGKETFKEFTEHVRYIMLQYEGISDFPISNRKWRSSRRSQIRVLEHFAINSIIRNRLSFFFTFDTFTIIVVPEKQSVNAGEVYNAQIIIACSDFFNPVKLIIENDTIQCGAGDPGPLFSIKTHTKGLFSQKAALLVKSWGKEEVYPFIINYEVK